MNCVQASSESTSITPSSPSLFDGENSDIAYVSKLESDQSYEESKQPTGKLAWKKRSPELASLVGAISHATSCSKQNVVAVSVSAGGGKEKFISFVSCNAMFNPTFTINESTYLAGES